MYVCPASGHLIDPHFSRGPNCERHGVPWFRDCRACGASWPLVAKRNYAGRADWGSDFCARCAAPAPWLTREQLMAWVRNQLRASAEVDRATALQLGELLGRLEQMDPDDTRTVEVWKNLRDTAPKVWEATKPARDVLIGEAVKRLLGL